MPERGRLLAAAALPAIVVGAGWGDPLRGFRTASVLSLLFALLRAGAWEVSWRRRTVGTATDAAAVALLAESMRSGATPQAAMLCCADVASPALAERLRLALRGAESLTAVAAELAVEGSDDRVSELCRRVGASVTVSDRVGGSLAEMTQMLAEDLREEVRLSLAVDTAVSGMRAAALLLGVLPVLGLLIGRGLFPQVDVTGGATGGCLSAGLICYAAGVWWLAWLIRRARRAPLGR